MDVKSNDKVLSKNLYKFLDAIERMYSKVVISNESQICINSGDDRGKFIWRLQNEREDGNHSNFRLKFSVSLTILGYMSSKKGWKIACFEWQLEFRGIYINFRGFPDSKFRR